MGRSNYNSDNLVALNVRDDKGKLVATYDVASAGRVLNTTKILVDKKPAVMNNVVADSGSLKDVEKVYPRDYKFTYYRDADVPESRKKKVRPVVNRY